MMGISNCVAQSFSKPWFYLHEEPSDVLYAVSTFTGSFSKIDQYTNKANSDRPDLGGHPIRVACPWQSSKWFFTMNETSPGYINIILNTIAKALNFQVEFVTAADGSYGNAINDTGRFSGMLGELQNNRADFGTFVSPFQAANPLKTIAVFHIAIGDISLTWDRSQVAGPSKEFWQEVVTFLYPDYLAQRDIYWKAFTVVFNPSSWIAITLITVGFVLYILALLFLKTDVSNKDAPPRMVETVLRAMSITLKAFVCLGSDNPQVLF